MCLASRRYFSTNKKNCCSIMFYCIYINIFLQPCNFAKFNCCQRDLQRLFKLLPQWVNMFEVCDVLSSQQIWSVTFLTWLIDHCNKYLTVLKLIKLHQNIFNAINMIPIQTQRCCFFGMVFHNLVVRLCFHDWKSMDVG